MEQLKEDYERRVVTIMNRIKELERDAPNCETIVRLKIKASCYRTFIHELGQALQHDRGLAIDMNELKTTK